MSLNGKKILLGVSGSIAAYKAAHLVRLLVKENAEVKVIMTPSSTEFITPLTLATLSKSEVLLSYINDTKTDWNNHVDIALWADVFLIAPCSANTLAKMSTGVCDNLLLAVYLSAKCPVFVAPAMDLDMYVHGTTQQNIKQLQAFGNHIVYPTEGELASGLIGKGRMAEPEQLVETLADFFEIKSKLKNKKIVVTAGPTYEAIDPVRFIGNHASGKMGFCIADELANRGAKVYLIAGPNNLTINHKNITYIPITSSDELFENTTTHFQNADVAICSAAVADYKPKQVAAQKIKKEDNKLSTIELVETKDTLKQLGILKQKNQLLIGFALETNNELENAKKKIKNKNLDFIVLNSLSNSNPAFKVNDNQITIINAEFEEMPFETKTKDLVAKDIANYLETYYTA